VSDSIRVIHQFAGRTDDVFALYQSAWWARDRSRANVATMLATTPVLVGLVDPRTDELIGFCRALTDQTFLAIILDVIVAPARRGEGLGARLLDEVLGIAEVRRAASIELVCQPELIPFYQRWGFTDSVGRSRLMRRASVESDQAPPTDDSTNGDPGR
jgi:GNAT superfamily N-acetyltransferase